MYNCDKDSFNTPETRPFWLLRNEVKMAVYLELWKGRLSILEDVFERNGYRLYNTDSLTDRHFLISPSDWLEKWYSLNTKQRSKFRVGFAALECAPT